jgi:hypothetical protein
MLTMRRMAVATVAGAVVAIGAASLAAGALPPPPTIGLRVTHARDANGQTVVSVWMTTNSGGRVAPTASPPLVFARRGNVTCPASPTFVAGGDMQVLYGGVSDFVVLRYQPVVRIPTTRTGALTVCGYLQSFGGQESGPVVTLTTARAEISVAPPRRRLAHPYGTGPWRSCPADRRDQLLRILSSTRLSGGCVAATRLADTWVNTMFRTMSPTVQPAYYNAVVPPVVHWTSFPYVHLHRTVACEATSAKGLPYFHTYTDIIVDCGLAAFRFTPGR